MATTDLKVLLMVLLSLTSTAVSAHKFLGKEKLTNIHFYFHDIVSGENATGVKVAQAPTANKSATAFGMLCMLDDPLTEGPEPSSKMIGKAQGICGSTGQKEFTLIMALSFFFTEGKLNGSTLSVLARNPILNPIREFPIAGGTGVFRFARGFMIAKTYFANVTTGDAIVEYNVTVVHY